MNLRCWVLAGACALAGCATLDEQSSQSDGAISSALGKPLLFSFRGEVTASKDDLPRNAVASQLQYMQGMLSVGEGANAQVGMPTIKIQETKPVAPSRMTFVYDASFAVMWPKDRPVPSTYDIVLPRAADRLDAFNNKYNNKCGVAEYGSDTFWHDFNPKAPGCSPAASDVVRASAQVVPHPQATEKAYPEYDKIWEDNRLDIVAVFGIIDSAAGEDDSAYVERDVLINQLRSSLTDFRLVSNAKLAGTISDKTASGDIVLGGVKRHVNLTTIVLESVSAAGPSFDSRYRELSKSADLIIYSGHSGLGKNVNSLAKNTAAVKGKYTLMYLSGCQTFAYLGPWMHSARIKVNGPAEDPEGTKFLDIIATTLPSYSDDGQSVSDLYAAMIGERNPATFQDLLKNHLEDNFTMVFGEHDNTFKPYPRR